MDKKSRKKEVSNKKPIQNKEEELKDIIDEENVGFPTDWLDFWPLDIDAKVENTENMENEKKQKNENFSKNKNFWKIMLPLKWKLLKIENWIISEILQENIKDDEYIIKWYDDNWQLFNICYRDNKTIKPFVRDLLENMDIETILTKRVRTILLFTIFNFLILFIIWYYSLINGNIIKKIEPIIKAQTINIPQSNNMQNINVLPVSEQKYNTWWINISVSRSWSIISEIDEKKRADELRAKMSDFYKNKNVNTQTWIIDNL